MFADQQTTLKAKEKELKVKKAELKIKQGDQQRQQKWRCEVQKKLKEAFIQNPVLKKTLRMYDAQGRSRLAEEQPAMLKAIVDNYA